MIHIEKGAEPEFWKGFRKKHPKIHYAQLEDTEEGKEIRQKLRKHLIAEQYSVCCYCCREIDSDNSLNEHIKPQSVFSEQTMDYENIIASCRGKNSTCGPHKDKAYDEALFVSPLDTDYEEHFAFAPDGSIIGLTDKGEYTIKLLGLDSYALQSARKAVYYNCINLDPDSLGWYLEPHEGKYEPFIDVIRSIAKPTLQNQPLSFNLFLWTFRRKACMIVNG